MNRLLQNKRLSAGLVAVVLLVGQRETNAIQTMPTITVNGGGGLSGGLGGSGGMPISEFPAIMAMIQGLAIATDVRCLGGAYSSVVSTSDTTERWLAAESVFRAVKQWANSNSKWAKGGLVRGDIMSITYADGGTENWIVMSPIPSAALEGAVPGSLRLGNGVVKPTAICASKG